MTPQSRWSAFVEHGEQHIPSAGFTSRTFPWHVHVIASAARWREGSRPLDASPVKEHHAAVDCPLPGAGHQRERRRMYGRSRTQTTREIT